MKKQRKEPWRIAVFVIAVIFILYMWVEKDIALIYESVPSEQILPMVVTTVAVSLFKVLAVAAALLLVKWIIGRLPKIKDNGLNKIFL